MRCRTALIFALSILVMASCRESRVSLDVAPNIWTLIVQDEQGARRNSSFRYVDDQGYFLLWGFMGFVTEYYGNPEVPYEDNNEYDIVVFDPRLGRWVSQFPFEKEEEYSLELPPMHLCGYYQGITTGSRRPQLKVRQGVLRPDLNMVFDQLAYDSKRSRMVYFTGGRTFAYEVKKRAWSDIGHGASPPPVMGGSLCYDQFNDQIVLAGGGHVAEAAADGRLVGYTGTWLYDCKAGEWSTLESPSQPPPRMCTRLVCDTKNEVLVVFGGDGQREYLADTWIYDTRTRQWRESKSPGGPPPRAGHFTVYDPETGWVIIGGGYNRRALTDMWAYDASRDLWLKLKGEVPAGWYVTADIVPDESLIVLTTSNKREGDTMDCNEIYPVRTTYAFKIRQEGLVEETVLPEAQENMLKRSIDEATSGTLPDPARRRAQLDRLKNMPVNQWILLSDPGRVAPLRTWGSCSFDTDKGRIICWGGGHCGYGGNDYDFYDVEQNTWITSPLIAEYPERAWDKGVNPSGVSFSGAPWIRHGRKVYAYDPVSKKIINMKKIVLTAGYEPEILRDCEPRNPDFGEGENFTMSSYSKWVTWAFDPNRESWEIVCSGLLGLDLTVTTPRGVMAVDHNWGAVNRKNRSDEVTFEGQKMIDNSVYLLDTAGRSWKKLTTGGPWPQNLYEMTALAYDSRRNQLILHGGGPERDELWRFKFSTGRWTKVNPRFAQGLEKKPPVCRREGMYIPGEDVFFTCGYPAGASDDPGVWVYRPGENRWYRVNIPPPEGMQAWSVTQQNRSMAYDPKHNLVLMVLGQRAGDLVEAVVYALRYDHSRAKFAR